MLKDLKIFYDRHSFLVNVLLISLILHLAYLNAVATPVFDESFYIPAARQILETGEDPNPEHPPLGKFIFSGSILVFGDNPLAWRMPSVLFGLACIVFFYFLVLRFANKKIASLSATFLALDPLHILLSRVAMLDIFMLTFMLAGAYFALKKDYTWAGFLFGLGMASKWPALLGLIAVMLFLALQKPFWKKFRPRDAAFLLLMAGLTYILVSAPFIVSQGPAGWLSSQTYYIGKSSTLQTTSVQASLAWEWLYLQKPVWFSSNLPDFTPPADMLWLTAILGGSAAFGIVALGNPVFWIPGLLAVLWLALNKSRKMAALRRFSLLWFVCTFVPFLLIPRDHMFIYYMLPVLPAYALALSQFLLLRKWERLYLVLLAASIVLFLPLVIGLPAPESYFEFLRPFIGIFP